MNDKKLNNLIKIGIGLITLSVLIFATNSWNTMDSLLKVGMLFIGGSLFYLLSLFVNKVLNLEKSSFVYYIISTVLFFFTFVGVGFYKVCGYWYSFDGAGNKLFIANMILVGCLIFYTYYFKKKNKNCLVISYYLLAVSLYTFNIFLNLDNSISMFLVITIFNVIYLLFKDKLVMFYKHIAIINYLTCMSSLYCYNYHDIVSIFVNIASLLLIIFNYYIYKNKNNNKIEKITIPVILCLTINNILSYINIISSYKLFILSILFSIYYIIESIFNKKSNISKITLIFIDSLLILLATISFCNSLSLPILYFSLMGIVLCLDLIKRDKLTSYLVVYKIVLLIISLFIYINECNYIILMLLIIFVIISIISIRKTPIYYIIFNIILWICILIYKFTVIEELFYGIFPLMIIINNILVIYQKDLRKLIIISSYIIIYLLFGINNLLFHEICVNNLYNISLISYSIIIISYILLYLSSKKDMFYKVFNSIMVLIPFINIIYLFDNYELLRFSIFLYVIINALYFDLKIKNYSYSKFLYIISPLILFSISNINILSVVFLFISIVYLIIGYSKDKYKYLFKYNMILLIIYLILNLMEFWISIPVYAYLFIGGIIIIVFVTKKELGKKEKPSNDYDTVIENNNITNISNSNSNNNTLNIEYHINYCMYCGNKLNKEDRFCSKCGQKIEK